MLYKLITCSILVWNYEFVISEQNRVKCRYTRQLKEGKIAEWLRRDLNRIYAYIATREER
jgi:hypothetical protein